MKLDEQLNLVVPVDGASGVVFVHSTPISREAFEAHFKLLAATYADLFGRSESYATVAPRVAKLTLVEQGRKIASADGRAGEDGGAAALLEDVKRLTVVAGSTADGWSLLPVDAAIKKGLLEPEDWGEVESAIVFFTLVYWMTGRRSRGETVRVMASAIGLSTTASPPSEWTSSLPRSTQEAASSEAPASDAEKTATGSLRLQVSR